ncbi:C2H2-type zinc finger transcription factor [Mucor lusitanicus]|uniref:C2H2-type zinc finger transcription factor n=2 Tax=Mucor circinelloides f. lusitanicus TaxID=29924 RepID=A0A168MCF4_MUCCL|nr:C2H2-type zinc finger transcription factor [Mucor lusitanicus]OAD04713.1 C2H2-type zinc finger transcription factor [Mucor lusitanicus CBS 277.49]
MDPNDNRIIVQLVNTCFMCRQMHVTARDLNQHLYEVHDLPVWRYSRPEPAQIEMIPTEQYIYLNMLAPNFDSVPHHAAFVAIRHACSLCHFHYPTLERLFRHMEAHFRAQTQRDYDDESDQLNQSFDWFDTHFVPTEATEAVRRQQESAAAAAFANENRGFQTNDGTVDRQDFHASISVNENQDGDQQDIGHATSHTEDSQSSVDDVGHSKETVINGQQGLGLQGMNGEEEGGFINNRVLNSDRDIFLGPFIDGSNANLIDQPLFDAIAPQETVEEDTQDNNTVFKFVYLDNP